VSGYRTVSRRKRNTVRSGGVAIFEKEECSPSLRSAEHDLLKNDKEALHVKRSVTAHDGVGDIITSTARFRVYHTRNEQSRNEGFL